MKTSGSISTTEQLQVHIRLWRIRRDISGIMAIENHESHEFPWSEREFFICNAQPDYTGMTGMVAEYDNQIVGFMMYDCIDTEFEILNLATSVDYRLGGVATQLVDKLLLKLSPGRRTDILADVRETNVPAQLFFRKVGFRTVAIVREFYPQTPDDVYTMRYRLGQGKAD